MARVVWVVGGRNESAQAVLAVSGRNERRYRGAWGPVICVGQEVVVVVEGIFETSSICCCSFCDALGGSPSSRVSPCHPPPFESS